MKIAVLLENSVSPDAVGKEKLVSAHGLSIHIERDRNNILFDVGPDGSFIENALIMGIELSSVDTVIISHGHSDHGGGLEPFFRINDKAIVYMHKLVMEPILSTARERAPKDIGLNRELIERYRNRIRFIDSSAVLAPGLTIYTCIGEQFPRPETNNNLFREIDGVLVPDDFRHEIVLSIEEKGETVIFTGCSHSGIVNMVRKVLEEEKKSDIKAVFGGFHLHSPSRKLNVSHEYLEKLTGELAALNTVFYTGHCTGDHNYARIKDVLGDKLQGMNTGQVLDF